MVKNEYYKSKDLELDGLIDENSEFRYSGKGENRVRILVDKKEISIPYFCLKKNKRGSNYFSCDVRYRVDGRQRTCSVGRYLLNINDSNIYCDHINKNVLDNRRVNLRTCTAEENSRNRYIFKGSSGYKNITYNGLSPQIVYEFRGVRNKINFSKYQSPFLLAIVADCIMMKNDPVFCVTNFDKSFYTAEFMEFILNGLELNI